MDFAETDSRWRRARGPREQDVLRVDGLSLIPLSAGTKRKASFRTREVPSLSGAPLLQEAEPQLLHR